MTSVALALGRRSARDARSLHLGLIAGLGTGLVLLLLFAGFSSVSSRSSARQAQALAAQQAAVADWEEAVHPLIESGGQVVALGPRTSIADLEESTAPDPQKQSMANAWVRRLTELRQQIAAVPTPQSLRTAHELLDSAMAGYVTASRDLAAAAVAGGAQRTQLLSAAAAAGKAADHQYDLATAAIARLRAQLKMPTDWSST